MLRLGEECEIEIDGKVWKFTRITVAIIRAIRDFIAERIGDPFAIADRYADKLPPDKFFTLVKEAEFVRDQLLGFTLSCPLAKRFLSTEEGLATLGHALLKKHQPTVTLDDALWVMKELGDQQGADLIDKLQGEIPPNSQSPLPSATSGPASATGPTHNGESCSPECVPLTSPTLTT